MNLESCVTLHAWKNNCNKYVICVIKVAKRPKYYFSTQREAHFTYHWLQPEHWAAFESKLNELAAGSTLKYFTRTLRFKLIDSIQLSISRTTIPIGSLCETIEDIGSFCKKDVIAAIECKFEYLEPEQCPEEFSPFKELQCNSKDEKKENERRTPAKRHHGRNPEEEKNFVSTRKKEHEKDESGKNLRRKNLTPSSMQLEPDQVSRDYLTPRKNPPSHTLTIPSEEEQSQDAVTPHKVQLRSSRENSHKKQANTRKEQDKKQIISKSEDSQTTDDPLDILSSKQQQSKSSNVTKKRQKKDEREENDSNSEEESTKSGKRKKYMETIPSSSESSEDSNEEDNYKKAFSDLNGNPIEIKKPNPKGETSLGNSAKKSPIASPLESSRGTKFTAPKSILATPASTSKRKLRKKIDIKSSASQECQTMNKWLSKNSAEKTKERTKPSDGGKKPIKLNLISSDSDLERIPNSDSQNSSLEKDEEEVKKVEDRREYNRTVAKFLTELIPKTPEKIQNLDLMELKSIEIIKTFDKYQPQMEILFEEFKSKSKPKHKNGVDHFLVMGLLSEATQLEMMNALSERYERSSDGLPKYGELFSNVLMPEWVLNVFMKRHGMTRQQAIEHIRAQNAYKVYTQSEVPIDESLMFES